MVKRTMGLQSIGLVVVTLLCLTINAAFGSGGTTPNIREIFIGRCLDYQEIGPGKNFDSEPKDCVAIWEAFFGAWGYTNPRDVTLANYSEFFSLAKQTSLPENKTLLWSGTYGIAHAYGEGGKRYVTLEDTLVGYLANGLTWCGIQCQECPGINYDECPDHQDLPVAARQAFWGGASATFAESARGLVSIMVNGTDPARPAYRPDSFMALFELPDLSTHVHIRVILANDLDNIALERCDTGSLVEMKDAIQSRGFVFVCVENPPDILHLMCVDNAQNRKCTLPPKQPIVGGGTNTAANVLGDILITHTTPKTNLIG